MKKQGDKGDDHDSDDTLILSAEEFEPCLRLRTQNSQGPILYWCIYSIWWSYRPVLLVVYSRGNRSIARKIDQFMSLSSAVPLINSSKF